MAAMQLTDFSIRLAEPDDLEKVSECARRAYEKYVLLIGKPPGPMLADYASSIASGHLYVAEHSGAICGFVACYAKDGKWLLENVAILPEQQGAGLGSRLVRFAEDKGHRAGQSVIVLYTHQKMTGNIGYYKSMGFREVGKRTEDGYDRVYMEKSLK